jgi:hypothetical protein
MLTNLFVSQVEFITSMAAATGGTPAVYEIAWEPTSAKHFS